MCSFPEILQNVWRMCLVVFHALTLKLPIQTALSVAPKLPVCLRSGEKLGKFRKTSTTLIPAQTVATSFYLDCVDLHHVSSKHFLVVYTGLCMSRIELRISCSFRWPLCDRTRARAMGRARSVLCPHHLWDKKVQFLLVDLQKRLFSFFWIVNIERRIYAWTCTEK